MTNEKARAKLALRPRRKARRQDLDLFLEGARAVLESGNPLEAARAMLESCCGRLGARHAFVALCSGAGPLEVVLVVSKESACLPPTVDTAAMYEAIRSGEKAIALAGSAARALGARNALLAPFAMSPKTTGILGLLDARTAFNENALAAAEPLAALVAKALAKGRLLGLLPNGATRKSICATDETAVGKAGIRTGQSVAGFVVPGDRAGEDEDSASADAGSSPSNHERRFLHSDGSPPRYPLLRAPLRQPNGTVTFIGAAGQETAEAQQALGESEERFRGRFESFPAPVFLTDRALRFKAINPALERAFGRPASEILGRAAPELIQPWTDELDTFSRRALCGETVTLQVSATLASRELAHLALLLAPISDTQGGVAGLTGIAYALSEPLRAEQALVEREAQFRVLVEHSPDIVARYDRDSRVLYANPSIERYFGPVATLVGTRVTEMGAPFTVGTRWREAIERVFQTGETLDIDFELPHDPPLVLNGRFIPEHDERGAVRTVVSLFHDLTELRRSEQDYHMLFGEMLDGFALHELIADADGRPADFRYLAANPAFERLTGICNPLGRTIRELLPGIEPGWIDAFGRVALTGKPERFEAYLSVLDKHFEVAVFSARRGQCAAFFQDITARKRSEQALQESEARYRSLFENSHTATLLIEPSTGAIIDANPAACALYGYPRDAMRGLCVRDLDASPPEHLLPMLARSLEVPQRFLIHSRLASGEVRDLEAHCGPMRIHSLPMVHCTLDDVTDRHRAEATLRRLWVAIEQTSEFVAITDEHRIIEYVNPAFEGLTGYSRNAAIGRSLGFLHAGNEGDDGGAIAPAGQWMGALRLRRNDGSIVDVEASLAALRDSEGKTTGYVAVHRDVTEQKKLERQLRQAQKMEALGTLAGGIAHDFNNILAAIMGFTTLAQNQLADEHPARGDLQEVVTASQRARDLVRQILAFSRRTEHRRSPLQVSVLAKEALKLLRATLPATIEIRGQFPDKDDYVLGDPTQIHQILMNLCTNAAHAMRERGGVLTVNAEITNADERLAASVSGLRPGAFVRLRVRDTGHGMDAATVERVFEPYFTTKPAGEGTGLGLPVVHGIVMQAGGAIAVSSEAGRGTTVDVYLPRHSEEPERSPAIPPSAPRGKGRILFIDDEPALARFGKQCLEGLGYQVVAVTSPTDALDLFEDDAAGFDLIITDQTMPHLTGLSLAREVHDSRPDLPILLCTGYSEAIPPDGARSIGVRQVLLKPLPPHELAHAVASALKPSERH